MSKSSQAFRTIREVADWLGVAAHVLRFWESKFPQIKPVKRAGGRRYYRPADMELVGGIKVLLHDQGMTIRGAQKKLREDGVAAIAALSPPLDGMSDGAQVIDGDSAEAWVADAAADAAPAAEEAQPAPTPTPVQADTPVQQTLFPEIEEQAEVPEEEPVIEALETETEEIAAEATMPVTEEDADAEASDTPDALETLADLPKRAKSLPDEAKSALAPAVSALKALRDRMRADPPA